MFLLAVEILYAVPSKMVTACGGRSCSRPQTRKNSTKTHPYQENTLDSNRNRWFPNWLALRHAENTGASAGSFPVAAPGNVVSWWPRRPGEGSQGLTREGTSTLHPQTVSECQA